MKINLLLLLVISISSCGLSEKEINKGWWKYGSGAHIADVINFSSSYHEVRNDTIYIHDVPKGIVIKPAVYDFESWFYSQDRLYVKSIKTSEIGIYHQKGI